MTLPYRRAITANSHCLIMRHTNLAMYKQLLLLTQQLSRVKYIFTTFMYKSKWRCRFENTFRIELYVTFKFSSKACFWTYACIVVAQTILTNGKTLTARKDEHFY